MQELAYQDRICNALPENEWFGELVAEQLAYFPTVTRETFKSQSCIPAVIESNQLFEKLDLPTLDVGHDRFMICGSPAMLKDTQAILESRGFAEGNMSRLGHYVIERVFVEK